MKRSEMIDIIFKRLGPMGISEPTCAEVLDLLEEAGTIPPDSSACSCEDCGGPNHTWDSEE